MITTVYKDSLGKVVHIGEWNEVKIISEVSTDGDTHEVVENIPIPEGWTKHKEEIVVLENGARVPKTNYKQLREINYPPIEEQLDYIYHNGLEAWKTDIIEPVKETYPKPEGE